jgi:uncharacterized membrane protein YphA (DoxX/SURF4 family)
MLLRRIARPLLSTVFIAQGLEALRRPSAAAEAARPTVDGLQRLPDPISAKVPGDAQGLAMATAVVQIGGGALLASGRLPRLASAALACSVVPGNLGAHMFWSETDPERKAQKRRAFMSDVSLLGGLIIASADTAGKPSWGWRGRRAAHRFSESVSSALPSGGSDSLLDHELGERLGHGLHVGAERGRELFNVASEKGAPWAEAALRRGEELAELARERGADWAELAQKRGAEWAQALPRG